MSFIATAIAGTSLAASLAAATGLSTAAIGAAGAGLATTAGGAALKGGSKAITKGVKRKKEDEFSKRAQFNTKSQNTGYGGPSMMGHNPISKHMGGKGAAMCGIKKK